jgi:hypothetical protein
VETHGLVTVFIPDARRETRTIPVDLHDQWVIRILKLMARLFGGATAYGRGVGVWRWRNQYHWDRITVVESWVSKQEDPARLAKLGREIVRMLKALGEKEAIVVVFGLFRRYRIKEAAHVRTSR